MKSVAIKHILMLQRTFLKATKNISLQTANAFFAFEIVLIHQCPIGSRKVIDSFDKQLNIRSNSI